jgi:hypothetical protein
MADEELSEGTILENKIINRLQKTVKREPSERQKKHKETLASKKKGTKYKKVEVEVEPIDVKKKKAVPAK